MSVYKCATNTVMQLTKRSFFNECFSVAIPFNIVSVDVVEIPIGDGFERRENSAREDSSFHDQDTNQEPCVGMIFESEEAAKTFYDEYAIRIGFLTRVLSSRKFERDGSIISRGLRCRGGSDKRTEQVQIQKRDRRREGCPAMFLVKREIPGRWIVRKFLSDHNHPLEEVTSQRSRPTPDDKDKKIQELTAELRVKKCLSAAYKEQLLAFTKDVEDPNVHLSSKVQVVVKNLNKLEAKRRELLQRG